MVAKKTSKKDTGTQVVRIKTNSVNKVKRKIIGTKKTIGGYYEEAAEEKLSTKK